MESNGLSEVLSSNESKLVTNADQSEGVLASNQTAAHKNEFVHKYF